MPDDPASPAPSSDAAARTLAELFRTDSAEFERAAKQLAGRNCSVDMPITGNSMGGLLTDGTVIRVALIDGAACRPGDVVVFRGSEEIVAHRALVRTADYLITRGDARIAPDQPVALTSVFGRVTGVVAPTGVLPVPPLCRPRWLLRVADCAAIAVAALTVRLVPPLARRWIGLLTWLERRFPRVSRIARQS
jgi:hypothetical protein